MTVSEFRGRQSQLNSSCGDVIDAGTNQYRLLFLEVSEFDDISVEIYVETVGVNRFGKSTVTRTDLETGARSRYLELCVSEG